MNQAAFATTPPPTPPHIALQRRLRSDTRSAEFYAFNTRTGEPCVVSFRAVDAATALVTLAAMQRLVDVTDVAVRALFGLPTEVELVGSTLIVVCGASASAPWPFASGVDVATGASGDVFDPTSCASLDRYTELKLVHRVLQQWSVAHAAGVAHGRATLAELNLLRDITGRPVGAAVGGFVNACIGAIENATGDEAGDRFAADVACAATLLRAMFARHGRALADEPLYGLVARALGAPGTGAVSMAALADRFETVAKACAFLPVAEIVLTDRARRGMAAACGTEEEFFADLNGRPCVEFAEKDCVLRATALGDNTFVVLQQTDDGRWVAVDAGRNENHAQLGRRRRAIAVTEAVFGPEVGVFIPQPRFCLRALYDQHLAGRPEAETAQLISVAETAIELQRSLLAAVAISAQVVGARDRTDLVDETVAVSAGREHVLSPTVDAVGVVKLKVLDARVRADVAKPGVVAAALQAAGMSVEAAESSAQVDILALFADLGDVNLVGSNKQIIGTLTRYSAADRTLHLRLKSGGRVTLERVADYTLRSIEKERTLDRQAEAIERLRQRRTAMPTLRARLARPELHQAPLAPAPVTVRQPELAGSQATAELVGRMLHTDGLFCLQGPPGTGKSTTIAELVVQALEHNPNWRILVCSQANEAVANAIEKVRKVREAQNHTWLVVREARDEVALQEGPWSGFDPAYRDWAAQTEFVSRTALKGRRQATPAVRAALEVWHEHLRVGHAELRELFGSLVSVWGTTTAASQRALKRAHRARWDLVIIDEAAKATVSETLLPMVDGLRIVLVGDHKQLPPFVDSDVERAFTQLGYSPEVVRATVFEHLNSVLPNTHRDMLATQYRMHSTIGSLVSTLFYDDRLAHGTNDAERPLPQGEFSLAHRVAWVDVAGVDQRAGRTSRVNLLEVDAVESLLDQLAHDASSAPTGAQSDAAKPLSVAIIAPYRAQGDELARRVERGVQNNRWPSLGPIKAATVNAFQGRDADVVIFSLVKTGSGDRSFVADERRFNVALSRARSLLLVVGALDGARSTPRLKTLLDALPAGNIRPLHGWVSKRDEQTKSSPTSRMSRKANNTSQNRSRR